jgi:hypothetical protein
VSVRSGKASIGINRDGLQKLHNESKTMRVVAFAAVVLIALLLTPEAWYQQSNAQPSQPNRQASKYQANDQPANTSGDQGLPKSMKTAKPQDAASNRNEIRKKRRLRLSS